MTGDTGELLRDVADAMCRNDLERFLELHTPDAEIFPLVVSLEGGSYRGQEGLRRFWEDIHGAFDDWCPQLENIREVGGVTVVAICLRGRGRDSGIAVERHVWQVGVVRESKLARWRIYTSEGEAFEAAGRGGP